MGEGLGCLPLDSSLLSGGVQGSGQTAAGWSEGLTRFILLETCPRAAGLCWTVVAGAEAGDQVGDENSPCVRSWEEPASGEDGHICCWIGCGCEYRQTRVAAGFGASL